MIAIPHQQSQSEFRIMLWGDQQNSFPAPNRSLIDDKADSVFRFVLAIRSLK
ncbi:Acyl-CoA dehydrogenase [Bibersteinia trehalosi USDA-ARS-USMARC-190]|uniref:Acyl-CoA dehydrogenase n=1 Tax=Bibersteinia trehalosi USDA-ARS-USMARC-190 TaxID=1263832 RepID=W0R721_BIBTR|nr:Acyl-CoA dehydrogenase [Bibersteinia trehalosi USDA-ARS-USMARC-190]